MSIKTILVHVDDTDRGDQCLAVALKLADRYDAHLTGLAVKSPVYVPAFAAAQVPPDIYETMSKEQDKVVRAAEKRFDEKVRAYGRYDRSSWEAAEGDIATIVANRARYSDLTVVGQENPSHDAGAYEGVPDNVILGAGRPVLVVPYIGAPDSFPSSAMVAWNGTREAARAVGDALPLLKSVKTIQLMSANPSAGDDVPGADIARYLSEHDLDVHTVRSISESVDVGDILLNEVSERGHDIVVMGGYGHHRFREMVLGGATRHILNHMTVPVLFSH